MAGSEMETTYTLTIYGDDEPVGTALGVNRTYNLAMEQLPKGHKIVDADMSPEGNGWKIRFRVQDKNRFYWVYFKAEPCNSGNTKN